LNRPLLHTPAAALPDPPPPAWLLQTSGLAGQRGERVLFQGLNLALAPGTVTWLRGTNGRGKTSLLRILAGLSSPQAGQLQLASRDGGAVLYLGHQNALKDDLGAAEALAFLAHLHGLPAAASAVTQALRRLGVATRQHAAVRTLSQGQRRRVALARLVLSRSVPVWLLDEPFDALDADGIDALNGVISEHALAGGCVLLTSHQPLTLDSPVPAVLDLEPYAPQ
jgi:heme exporter protein A